MPFIDPRLLSLSSQSDPATPPHIPRRPQRRTRPIVIRDHTVQRPLEPRPKRGPHSGITAGAAGLQEHRISKKQRKPRAKSTKTAKESTARNAPEASNKLDSDGDSGRVASDDGIRWKDGLMEWWDDEDLRWKPARYHHDCRAELLHLAAQQPGAPVWTPDMGVDCTSFSYLTRGWNMDPLSVFDAEGRQVLLMNQRPADFNIKVTYDLLKLNGCILLNADNDPVRDIPGLPLTLKLELEGWFITGLRRSLRMEMKDMMARLPPYWHAKTGVRKVQKTAYTTRMGRWLEKRGMMDWNRRPNAQAKRRSTAKRSRRSARIVEHDAGAEILTQPPQTLMGTPYGHYGYGQEDPYHNAAHPGAGSSPFDSDDPWVTTRETSIPPDLDINAPPKQYPLPPSYHDTDDMWATTRETSILPDPDIHLPPNQYPLPPAYHHPPFDFSFPPPTYPNDRLESADFQNLFDTGLDDDDDDNDDDDSDKFGPEGMSTYLDPSVLDPEMMLEEDLLSGLENL